MLAMDVNDNACCLIDRVVQTFFASKLAPTGICVDGPFSVHTGKQSTYIQFFLPPSRHYRIQSRRIDAVGFSFVRVGHEHFAK